MGLGLSFWINRIQIALMPLIFILMGCNSFLANTETSESSSAQAVRLSDGSILYSDEQALAEIDQTKFTNSELKLLPIRPMLTRLESLVGTQNTALLNKMVSNRYLVGDYDYASGVPENLAVTSQQHRLWMEGIESICTASSFQTKYQWSNFTTFVEDALGREFSSTDTNLMNQINAVSATDKEKFEIGCFTILGSLEFKSSAVADSSPNSKVRAYLANLKSALVGESLSTTEINQITANGTSAVANILYDWTTSPSFGNSAKSIIDRMLKTSGQKTNINYDFPGNLAKHISEKQLPIGELLSAHYCVDNNNQKVDCDTGSPNNAGIITTRAFLTTYKGVFNISRSVGLMRLLCEEYPLHSEKEPRLQKVELIDFFASNTGKVQFGNGNNCYLCHAQMGLHAQLFVKFDVDGFYQPNATGLPTTTVDAIAGFSDNGLFQSHLKEANRASLEQTRVFGKTVDSIAEGGKVLAQRPEFLRCMARQILGKTIGMTDVEQSAFSEVALEYLVDQARMGNNQPTYTGLVVAIFSNPAIINRFAQ